MDIDKVERRLKKIITVFDAFKEDGKISSIEKDLLLGYIRELYEIVQETELKSNVGQTFNASSNSVRQEFKIPQIEQTPGLDTPQIEYKPVHQAEEMVQEAPVEDKVTKKEDIVNPEDNARKVIVDHFTPQLNHTKVEEAVVSISKEDNKDHSSEMEKLFIISKAVDLSDKLAMSHIEDINKAMGINEKLFNQNELFGGNNVLFSETINHLNKLTSFEEAKTYLIYGVAKDQKWDSDARSSKAHQFIKLIYRKYN